MPPCFPLLPSSSFGHFILFSSHSAFLHSCILCGSSTKPAALSQASLQAAAARGTLSSRDRMVQTPSSSPARPPSSSVETSRPAARCPPETKCRGNLLRVRHEQRDRTQMRGSLHPIALRKKLPLPLRRSAFLMQESGCVQKFGKIISPNTVVNMHMLAWNQPLSCPVA